MGEIKIPEDPDALLTLEQFIVWAGMEVSPQSRRWAMIQARTRKIPAVKLGGVWRFHRPSILAACSTKPTKQG
jgi:hypothetical protein